MFIDQTLLKTLRRSEERNVSRWWMDARAVNIKLLTGEDFRFDCVQPSCALNKIAEVSMKDLTPLCDRVDGRAGGTLLISGVDPKGNEHQLSLPLDLQNDRAIWAETVQR
jgi:hypothetical protein